MNVLLLFLLETILPPWLGWVILVVILFFAIMGILYLKKDKEENDQKELERNR